MACNYMLFSLYNLIDCSKGKDTWVLAATVINLGQLT